MPWSSKQLKVIQARRHGWTKGTAFKGLAKRKLDEMSREGLREGSKAQARMLEGGKS